MEKLRGVLFLAAILAFASCSTTSGILMKGQISNNTYTAQDKSFSVALPQKKGTYEFAYMKVKEQYTEEGAYVSFGPFAFDQSIYRIETVKPVTPDSQNMTFDVLAPRFVEGFKAQLQEGYGTAPEETESRLETINGKKAYYCKLTQTLTGAKSGKLTVNEEGKLAPEDVSVIHDVYVIDFETKGVALVGVQNSEIAAITPGLEPRAFAESLKMY